MPTPDAAADTRATARFGHLAIEYDARVLTPRAWTRHQSEWAADLLATAPPGPVLELCCGAGHIGLLAVARSRRQLVCVDANPAACELTRRNAAAAGMADRVEVRHGDLAEAVPAGETYALVVADPPYLRPDELSAYPDDPRLAVDGGGDGLEVARRCVAVVRGCLGVGGSALVQLRSSEQAARIGEEAAAGGGLLPVESRSYDRGVVLRLERH